MDKVLVLDSEDKVALTIIRSLGKKKIKITAGGFSKFLPGILSKYSKEKFIHSNYHDDYKIFLKELIYHIKKNNYFAIFPSTDYSSVILSKYKDILESFGVKVAIENWENFLKTYDKKITFELAEKLGIPYPKTISPETFSDLNRLSKKLTYPVVIKPRSKSIWDNKGKLHLFKITGKNYAYSRKLLLKQYNDILEENKVFRNYLPLVQEFISGKIYDTVVLAEKGEILTYFQNIRLRTYPKEGGAYTFAEGIKKNSKMLNYARILIKEIGWTGPAMIEFMKSDDDNKFYLMEINGRYWGSIPLTVKSGIDVPWLHYLQLRKSLKNIKNHHYNIIKLRWLIPGEILWLFDNLKAGNFKSIIAFLHSFSNSKYAILSIKDPKPFLGNFLYFLVLLKEILIGSRNIMGERT